MQRTSCPSTSRSSYQANARHQQFLRPNSHPVIPPFFGIPSIPRLVLFQNLVLFHRIRVALYRIPFSYSLYLYTHVGIKHQASRPTPADARRSRSKHRRHKSEYIGRETTPRISDRPLEGQKRAHTKTTHVHCVLCSPPPPSEIGAHAESQAEDSGAHGGTAWRDGVPDP